MRIGKGIKDFTTKGEAMEDAHKLSYVWQRVMTTMEAHVDQQITQHVAGSDIFKSVKEPFL